MPRKVAAAAAPTAPTARSRKGAATRARLIDAAKDVFEESGFLDARITDITAHAGLSQGTFYHYFDSKEPSLPARSPPTRRHTHGTTRGRGTNDGPVGRRALPVRPHPPRQPSLPPALPGQRPDHGRHRGGLPLRPPREHGTHRSPEALRRSRRTSIRRWQAVGAADADIDPAIATVALGSMVGRFAELWLVEDWATFDFDHAVDQVTRLWANSIDLREPPKRGRRKA